MEESEYRTLADACLQRVARWLEGIEPDEVDYTTGDGMLTLEFPDGARFVLNRQGAARQIWFAAGARGWEAVDDYALDWADRHVRVAGR